MGGTPGAHNFGSLRILQAICTPIREVHAAKVVPVMPATAQNACTLPHRCAPLTIWSCTRIGNNSSARCIRMMDAVMKCTDRQKLRAAARTSLLQGPAWTVRHYHFAARALPPVRASFAITRTSFLGLFFA